MELHEYTSYDAIGLRDLLRAREVAAPEIEAVAREALSAADAELNAPRCRSSRRLSTTPPTGRSLACRS